MSKFNQQINRLSQKQIAFARLVQNNGLDSYSQAVKALANGDDARIQDWKEALEKLEANGKLIRKYD